LTCASAPSLCVHVRSKLNDKHLLAEEPCLAHVALDMLAPPGFHLQPSLASVISVAAAMYRFDAPCSTFVSVHSVCARRRPPEPSLPGQGPCFDSAFCSAVKQVRFGLVLLLACWRSLAAQAPAKSGHVLVQYSRVRPPGTVPGVRHQVRRGAPPALHSHPLEL
jgi:hypothetical protein